jgi:hypothetical protein
LAAANDRRSFFSSRNRRPSRAGSIGCGGSQPTLSAALATCGLSQRATLSKRAPSTTNFFTQPDATWSANGSDIAFDAASYRIDADNVDGSNLRTIVNNGFWAHWSADGRFALTRRTGPGPTPFGGFETRIFVPIEGGAQRQLIPNAVNPAVALFGDNQPDWAP